MTQTYPPQTPAYPQGASAPRPAARPPAPPVYKVLHWGGLGFLWLASGFFLLQAVFQSFELQHVNAERLELVQQVRQAQGELADWQQRHAYATSEEFLDEAVKEYYVSRDANERAILVEPSPVPPVGDIR